MIEKTTSERDRQEIKFRLNSSWTERYARTEEYRQPVTIHIRFITGEVNSLEIKRGMKMGRLFKDYCDRYRGGVHRSDLRFMRFGERIGDDETFSDLDVMDLDEDGVVRYKIDCFLPQPCFDAEFLAKVGAS